MSSDEREVDVPGVLVFPPVLLGGAMVLGFALDWLRPTPLLPAATARTLGVALFALSAALGGYALRTLVRAGTNVSPEEPTLALVTDGPYRWTRNPIYVAGLGVCLATAFLVNGVAPLLLLVPAAALLHWGVVLREERYLAAKFGEAYRAYRSRVRRWI